MDKITQLMQSLSLDDHTRVVVPYISSEDGTYRAWHKNHRIQYNPSSHLIVLHDNNEKLSQEPLIYVRDGYRNKLFAVFEFPYREDKLPQPPFLRVDVVQHYSTRGFSAQGPVFVITELDTPEL